MAADTQRLMGILGIAFVVATIAPAFFLPPPPPGGAALAEVARYYSDHRDVLLLGGWIGLLGFPFAFGFLAGLGVLLSGEGKVSAWLSAVALVSIAVALAVALVQGILAQALPYVTGSVSAEELKFLADVTQLGFSIAFVPYVAYFVTTGALVLRSQAMPRWLG